MANNKIPNHVGFIPDGNRRWAVDGWEWDLAGLKNGGLLQVKFHNHVLHLGVACQHQI